MPLEIIAGYNPTVDEERARQDSNALSHAALPKLSARFNQAPDVTANRSLGRPAAKLVVPGLTAIYRL
jgi:hypothetical protein